MNLYISDLHFGHENVIGFDNRPFKDVEEMNCCMIENWNGKVGEDDDVWIVWDFCHRSGKSHYKLTLPSRSGGNHAAALMNFGQDMRSDILGYTLP